MEELTRVFAAFVRGRSEQGAQTAWVIERRMRFRSLSDQEQREVSRATLDLSGAMGLELHEFMDLIDPLFDLEEAQPGFLAWLRSGAPASAARHRTGGDPAPVLELPSQAARRDDAVQAAS